MEFPQEIMDREACYKVFESHDPRFDGRIFVGVTSTGIYCRPICPARVPMFKNCRFFASAAAAQEAGFRPCLRCRPEIAPELAFWRGTSNTVSRALKLITEGALDESEAGVEAFAEKLGVGGRQLRRLFSQHLGASPIAVAQTRRVLFAKQLLHDTQLPMTEVALSAGFGSVRRFNETFRKLFGRPPSALRRRQGPDTSARDGVTTLRISLRTSFKKLLVRSGSDFNCCMPVLVCCSATATVLAIVPPWRSSFTSTSVTASLSLNRLGQDGGGARIRTEKFGFGDRQFNR